MGERKVLNKYYPPDFNPATIPRRRQPKNNQAKVTMMLPMSIRCGTCGNYIYRGTKFNSRQEDSGEDYLGIKTIRLYFKCPNCSSELKIKTDPKDSDYVVEPGALRNSEPWRAEDEAAAARKKRRREEEEGDAMKSLENRTAASKREIEIDATLHELKSMKTRRSRVSSDAMLDALNRARKEDEKKRKQEEEEDEALVRSIFGKRKVIRKINDNDLEDKF